jgi:hypothetical protein
VREEEVCQILHLKKNLDFSDTLITYATRYLHLGWELVAVNGRGEDTLGLDFTAPERVWQPRLTELGLDGVQVNLGVRTGVASNLLVLEVHRGESLFPFSQRGDWSSACVALLGDDREQHYYLLPRNWQPPASFFLNSFQIMVMGEQGLVLAPPSVEPQLQDSRRWLKPPWEAPPSRISPVLCKFLQKHAPTGPPARQPDPASLPAWRDLYPLVARHPGVLQCLLAPAADVEEYYLTLLKAAREAGLEDPRLLSGLLWHAPLGDAQQSPQRWQSLQELISLTSLDLSAPDPRAQEAAAEAFWAEALAAGLAPEARGSPVPPGSHAAPPPVNGDRTEPFRPETPFRPQAAGEAQPAWGSWPDAWAELQRLTRDGLFVERRRYEAMIYELGKLGAWHEVMKRETKDNKQLREKLEGQWTRDLEYFRQMAQKHQKKGWRWWQED